MKQSIAPASNDGPKITTETWDGGEGKQFKSSEILLTLIIDPLLDHFHSICDGPGISKNLEAIA